MNAGQPPIMSDSPTPRPDNARPARRWLWWGLAALLLLVAAGIGARQLATNQLKARIEQALGPNSEVTSIEVGLSAITITGIRIRASKDWPAADELSARQVVVRPDWGALMSRNIRVESIEVEDAYLSMLRRKDGQLVMLPSLLGTPSSGKPAPAKSGETSAGPDVIIGRVALRNAAVDFHDASVRQPAHKLRLEQTSVAIGQLHLPDLSGQTGIALDGEVKGVQRDGKVSIKGWVEVASKDMEMQTRLTGVDLVAFQPYLIKAAETGVKKGSMDLDLKSTVRKNRLHAPGKVTLSGLELSTGKTFMGMPREAVVGMMKDKNGRITAEFVLEGNIDDPKFSLNDKFLTQVGGATAKFLGISLEGLATGIGSAGGAAAQGIGSAVGKLFGNRKPQGEKN
jgi:hypothetical protein